MVLGWKQARRISQRLLNRKLRKVQKEPTKRRPKKELVKGRSDPQDFQDTPTNSSKDASSDASSSMPSLVVDQSPLNCHPLESSDTTEDQSTTSFQTPRSTLPILTNDSPQPAVDSPTSNTSTGSFMSARGSFVSAMDMSDLTGWTEDARAPEPVHPNTLTQVLEDTTERSISKGIEQQAVTEQKSSPLHVVIEKGSNKGKTGVVLRLKDKRTYEVLVDGTNEKVGVRIASVRQQPLKLNSPKLPDNTTSSVLVPTTSVPHHNSVGISTQPENVTSTPTPETILNQPNDETPQCNYSNSPELPGVDTQNAPILPTEPSITGTFKPTPDAGKQVTICRGKHTSKTATILGLHNRITYTVLLLEEGDEVNVRKSSVKFTSEQSKEKPSSDTSRSEASPRGWRLWPRSPRSGQQSPSQTAASPTVMERDIEKQSEDAKLTNPSVNRPTTVDNSHPHDDPNSSVSSHVCHTDDTQHLPLPPVENTFKQTPDAGKQVSIVSGKHKSKTGTILRLNNRTTYTVQLLGEDSQVNVRKSSIKFISTSPASNSTSSRSWRLWPRSPPSEHQEVTHTTSNSTPDRDTDHPVETDMSRSSPSMMETRQTALPQNPQENQSKHPHYNPSRPSATAVASDLGFPSRQSSSQPTDGHQIATNRQASSSDDSSQITPWMVPQTYNPMKFGSRPVRKIRLRGDNEKMEVTMLSQILGDRMMIVDGPLNGRANQRDFDFEVEKDGERYELVSAKLYTDLECATKYSSPKVARLVYAKVSGPSISTMSVKDLLSRIGDFGGLKPRKIMARLELLQSPARFPIKYLDESDFRVIEDRGYVGCGFICEKLLANICDNGVLSKPASKLVVAIQVRLFIPSMGIFKGMLQRKQRMEGDARIELPASMKKVLASTHNDALTGAALLVCKAGVHPSPGSANEYLGRRMDNRRKSPPEKSFTSKIKPLSKMVLRLWKDLGVPESKLENYSKQSTRPAHLNHAWIVGVADPTGLLPPDHAFVPGLKDAQPEQIFVTRSPCVKHDHGRILPLVTSKPIDMSESDWKWLNDLPFGCIMFSNPRPGKLSIPERIADGDLDGDLYLVCWDETMLRYMTNVAPMEELDAVNDGTPQPGRKLENWLEQAQRIMVDASQVNSIGKLTGVLYKLAEKTGDKSNEGMADRDAAAFAEAFTKALEFKKHGGPIFLPRRLHEKLPPGLRKCVASAVG